MKNIQLFLSAFSVLPPAYHEIFFPPSKLGEPRDHWRYPQIYGKWHQGLLWLTFGCLLTFLCITPPLPREILLIPVCFLLLAVWSFYRSLRLGLVSMVRKNLHVLKWRRMLLDEAHLMDHENGTPNTSIFSIAYDVANNPHYGNFWRQLRIVLKHVRGNVRDFPSKQIRQQRVRHLEKLFEIFGVRIRPDKFDIVTLTTVEPKTLG